MYERGEGSFEVAASFDAHLGIENIQQLSCSRVTSLNPRSRRSSSVRNDWTGTSRTGDEALPHRAKPW